MNAAETRSRRPDRQATRHPSSACLLRAESSLRTLLGCVGAPDGDPRRAAASAAVEELLGSDPAAVHAALRRLALASAPATLLQERYRLTDREVEVAHLLALGKSNSEVAAALSISEHTCRRHTERVLTKLGVRSRAAVAASLAQIGRLREAG
jgi:DNA-binding NarL/FixJ family response regulator